MRIYILTSMVLWIKFIYKMLAECSIREIRQNFSDLESPDIFNEKKANIFYVIRDLLSSPYSGSNFKNRSVRLNPSLICNIMEHLDWLERFALQHITFDPPPAIILSEADQKKRELKHAEEEERLLAGINYWSEIGKRVDKRRSHSISSR